VRGEPHADAVGGTVDSARWQRARRTGGQPVSVARCLREQRAARRKGPDHHRGHGRAYSLPGADPRASAVALIWFARDGDVPVAPLARRAKSVVFVRRSPLVAASTSGCLVRLSRTAGWAAGPFESWHGGPPHLSNDDPA